MEFFKRLSWITRLILSIGFFLLLYGYCCRLVGFYFFWESKSIGWATVFIGIICFLSGNIKYKRPNDKNSVAEKIGIAFFSFTLLVQCGLVIMIANSSAFTAIENYIQSNDDLKVAIGDLKGMTVIPFGAISVSSGQAGEEGEGNIYITVKGTKKYIDLHLFVAKDFDTGWTIVESE